MEDENLNDSYPCIYVSNNIQVSDHLCSVKNDQKLGYDVSLHVHSTGILKT